MKLSIEQLISIISAVGISAIIGTIFTFIQFNKKNSLDFVTTERAEWRRQLKQILIDLTDDEKRTVAITKLKSQINPYGKNMDIKCSKPYYMKDGHIWDILDKHKIDYDRLSLYIELLLKYDWERSKQEIRSKPSRLLNWCIRLALLISSMYACYIIHDKFKFSFWFDLSLFSLICILLQQWITDIIRENLSRNKKGQMWIFMIFYAIPYASTSLTLLLNVPFLKSNLLTVFAFVGLFVYGFYFLSLIKSVEDDYVREVERVKAK
ncbi:hypothetical protein [Streptococcus sinensis]|uniref:hypothetical protein n=1 Tax=Streptococcus sinensis TaxID=176090 RepID=UPI001CEDCF8D|nr:hypothetical protein [Streptococcus sinensis]MCD1277390.1 hypothetical protein [Streptococcus sinensis]